MARLRQTGAMQTTVVFDFRQIRERGGERRKEGEKEEGGGEGEFRFFCAECRGKCKIEGFKKKKKAKKKRKRPTSHARAPLITHP